MIFQRISIANVDHLTTEREREREREKGGGGGRGKPGEWGGGVRGNLRRTKRIEI